MLVIMLFIRTAFSKAVLLSVIRLITVSVVTTPLLLLNSKCGALQSIDKMKCVLQTHRWLHTQTAFVHKIKQNCETFITFFPVHISLYSI